MIPRIWPPYLSKLPVLEDSDISVIGVDRRLTNLRKKREREREREKKKKTDRDRMTERYIENLNHRRR